MKILTLTLEFPAFQTGSSPMIQENFQSTQFQDPHSKHTLRIPLPILVNLTVATHSIRKLNNFRTEHKLHRHSTNSYAFHTFAFAIDPATNVSLGITQFAVGSSLNGFTISSRGRNVAKAFTYDTGSGATTVEIEARALEVEIRRSILPQALTMSMFTTTWVLTILSAYITFSAVTTGRVGFAAVILHGSVAFAIASIRGLYLSPPPFGAFLGTLPIAAPFSYSTL
jgi:hypothetical protein